jgi:hypothetical protein
MNLEIYINIFVVKLRYKTTLRQCRGVCQGVKET